MGEEVFWSKLDRLVGDNNLVVDRPAGSTHPRYPSFVYPLDYGFLEGTRSEDGEGVDVWVGSGTGRSVTAILCAVDLEGADVELKILVGCTVAEANVVLKAHNVGSQSAVLIRRRYGPELARKDVEKHQEGNR
jgi:inorganic pyrophosphatase